MKNFVANIKKSINKYLERMAEANKKNFGNARLDCCSLNKGNNLKESKGNSTHR
jgi:hypothetical protein